MRLENQVTIVQGNGTCCTSRCTKRTAWTTNFFIDCLTERQGVQDSDLNILKKNSTFIICITVGDTAAQEPGFFRMMWQ